MGYNTVTVLFNDMTGDLLRAGPLGEKIVSAMRSWSSRHRNMDWVSFGCGAVVSQAHADYSQVVVVGQNRGRPIVECGDLDSYALGQIADALRRHGWDVSPPKPVKKVPRKKGAVK